MPSPPTAPATVTDPISARDSVRADVEFIDVPGATGLDVQVLPTDGR